ncbi:MAG TPA: sulfatase-like hydrolase/transferase [Acidobacteriota bacterium]|nr:sulfatase-like hydrolase/transferase [Acidobacteriota bacterium]
MAPRRTGTTRARLAATLLACGAAGCSGETPSGSVADARGDGPYNVVVVTLDTLRADHIGAYGFTEISTPAIDGLARDGVLFESAHSTTPLTLPAHASLFTGNYPLLHGVIDNGGFVVPEEAETLAEVLGAEGYRTAGFVAAYVLDRRWRIDQGFDRYVDDFDVRGKRVIAMGGVQRPANEVVDHAIDWLDQSLSQPTQGTSEQPFFMWLHMYDPHAPYTPPEPYASRYPGRPYVGEIAYTDSQVGRLLQELRQRELLDNTLVVLAADHGESLGGHGEAQHGFFVYEEAMHVPLIIRVPFGDYGGQRRSEPVSLVDVMPTVLEILGIEPDLEFQGRSLAPLFQPGTVSENRYIYSESWYARLHYGWSDLRALRDQRYKLILSSDPELYDLTEDPGEQNNLAGTLNTVLFEMTQVAQERIAAWSVGANTAAAGELDEETRQKLVSLGYIGTFQAIDADADLASPHSKIEIYNKSLEARQAMGRDELAEAERLLREVLADDPGIVDAYHTLGELYFRQGRLEEVVEAYSASIPLNPDHPYAYIFTADALAGLGRLDEAERTVRDGLELVGDNAQLYFLLGDLRRRQSDLDGAIAAFLRCLELDPDGSSAHGGLAQAYFHLDRFADAESYARAALELDDQLIGVHAVLAEIHDQRGEAAAAVREYLQEIEIAPEDVAAHFNLAMVYRKMGREDDEYRQLQRVLEIDPQFAQGNVFMARQILRRGGDLQRAIEMVEGAITESLDAPDMTLGYFLLADLYNRIGDAVLAQEWARRGQQLRQQIDGG